MVLPERSQQMGRETMTVKAWGLPSPYTDKLTCALFSSNLPFWMTQLTQQHSFLWENHLKNIKKTPLLPCHAVFQRLFNVLWISQFVMHSKPLIKVYSFGLITESVLFYFNMTWNLFTMRRFILLIRFTVCTQCPHFSNVRNTTMVYKWIWGILGKRPGISPPLPSHAE